MHTFHACGHFLLSVLVLFVRTGAGLDDTHCAVIEVLFVRAEEHSLPPVYRVLAIDLDSVSELEQMMRDFPARRQCAMTISPDVTALDIVNRELVL
jgi:hypothetical protein